MTESPRCQDVRELLPELAMGVAPGDARARALTHLAGCADCRRELEDVAAIVDELLLLAPEQEPPAGFDLRVLRAIDEGVPHHRVRTGLLVAASLMLVAALTAGFTWLVGEDDRTVANQYRNVLEVADGSYLRAADLRADGATLGNVFAYQGRPSWLFVTVEASGSGTYPVRMVTSDGQAREIGMCTLRNGSGVWGTTVDVPIRSIERIELVRDGYPALVADLHS